MEKMGKEKQGQMIVYHLIDLLKQGFRLPAPENCPAEVGELTGLRGRRSALAHLTRLASSDSPDHDGVLEQQPGAATFLQRLEPQRGGRTRQPGQVSAQPRGGTIETAAATSGGSVSATRATLPPSDWLVVIGG